MKSGSVITSDILTDMFKDIKMRLNAIDVTKIQVTTGQFIAQNETTVRDILNTSADQYILSEINLYSLDIFAKIKREIEHL